MAITRRKFNSKLFKGLLDRVFWPGYNSIPPVYTKLFNVASDDQAEVTQLGMVGFGGMYRKNERGRIQEVEFGSGREKSLVHVRYALGMRVSKETIDDMKYPQISKAVALFGRSAIVTKETLAASIWNNAFNAAYRWHPDVAEALIQSHTLDDGVTTCSNLLSVAADFDVTPAHQMFTLLRGQLDPVGIKTTYRRKYVVGAAANEFTFKEVLRSSDRPDTAERATNVIQGAVEDVTWDYLTDDDAWFVQADQHEMWWYDREGLATGEEPIAQTAGDRFYYATMRNSCGVFDWRGIVGTPGAG